MQIILASGSHIRQTLLTNAGVSFTAVPAEIDERAVSNTENWTPQQTASNLAVLKAKAVSLSHPEHLIIGADQVLALGSEIYSKPRDLSECRRHLQSLRGREHVLISSVCCLEHGLVKWSHVAEARIGFRDFTDDFLDKYLRLEGNECLKSVGGYKLEGRGVQFIETFTGDYFTVLGLPLIPLLSYLRVSGLIGS